MRRTLTAAALAATLWTHLSTAPTHLLDPLRAFLSQLWGGGTAGGPATAGCHWDPNGRCLPAAPPRVEAGCRLDPDGRCLSGAQPTLEAGCHLDPNGQCKPGS